jgi:hypothetical protein
MLHFFRESLNEAVVVPVVSISFSSMDRRKEIGPATLMWRLMERLINSTAII